MRKYLLLLLNMLPLFLVAQMQKQDCCRPRIIASGGFAGGESGMAPLAQLSGGLVFGKYYTGLALGYDRYIFQAFPLLADLRMFLGRKQFLYGYAQPGFAIPGKFEKEEGFSENSSERMMGGFYLDAGLGYRIPLGAKHRLSFSAGYIYKTLHHRRVYRFPCGIIPCTQRAPEIYLDHYRFGLINTRLSWEWGR